MKKILISLIVFVTLGVLYAQSDRILSFFVSQRLVMNEDVSTADQSSEIYFEVDRTSNTAATYIYSPAAGEIDIVSDSAKIGTGSIAIWKIEKSGTTLLVITAADTFVVDSVRSK